MFYYLHYCLCFCSCVCDICMVEILYEGVLLPISSQLWVQSCHVGSLILATAGVCTPWKSADATGPCPLESQWLSVSQHTVALGSYCLGLISAPALASCVCLTSGPQFICTMHIEGCFEDYMN